MAEVIKEFMVCSDCWHFHHGMQDYFDVYSVPDTRIEEIRKFFIDRSYYTDDNNEVRKGCFSDSGEHEEFSSKSCDVCSTPLGGERHELVLLSC